MRFKMKIFPILIVTIAANWIGYTVSSSAEGGPTFTQSNYSATLSTSVNVGHAILSLSTFDSPVYYHLLSQCDVFTISPNGTLMLARSLNSLQHNPHCVLTAGSSRVQLTAGASYVQHPFHTTYIQIDIGIPGGAPMFDKPYYEISVSENQLVNVPFYSIVATTTDPFPISYSIVNGDDTDGIFNIDNKTGRIVITQSLIEHQKDSYGLIIQASNRNLFNTSATVNITITRVLSFTQQKYTFNASSNRNASTIIGVVNLINCSHSPLSSSVNYTINNDVLMVNSVTGELYLIADVQHSIVSGIVTATYGNKSIESEVEVNILAVTAPQLPYHINHHSISLDDNALAAADISVQSNKYKILHGNCMNHFAINKTTGQITLDQNIYPLTYHLTIGWLDDNNILIGIDEYDIRIIDANNPPLFCHPIYEVKVLQETSIGTVISQVQAIDKDNSDILNYTSSDIPPYLSLSSSIGLITTIDTISPLVSSVNFTVIANDGNLVSNKALVSLIITRSTAGLTPRFPHLSYNIEMSENSPPGSFLSKLQATYDDATLNEHITYKLIGSKVSLNYLYITPSGELLTRWPIDREQYSSLSLSVNTINTQDTSLYSTTHVTVTVTDLPDNRPIFLQEVYSITISTPIAANDVLLTVSAITPDTTGIVSYQLLNGSDIYTIDTTSGSIRPIRDIPTDSSVVVHHILVEGSNGHNLSSTVVVIITISRDNPIPDIHPSTIYVSLLPYHFSSSIQHIGNLSVDIDEVEMTLSPSLCQANKYFSLTSNGYLYMYHNVTSRDYVLNVTINESAGRTWSSTVLVQVKLIDSLDNAVSLTLPDLKDEVFLVEKILPSFISTSTALLSCQNNCMEIISVQTTLKGSVIAFSVLTPDLSSHYSPDHIRNILQHEVSLSSAIGWTAYIDDPCSDSSCLYFQQCSSQYSFSPSLLFLSSPSISTLSHPYTLSSTCVCGPGYELTGNCSIEIDECSINPCLYGTCTDKVNDYECDCPSYTSGKNCSLICPSNVCERCTNNPCYNGAACQVQGGTTICIDCPSGFDGPLCELTTAHLMDGFISLPPLDQTSSLNISFSFSTIQPNALLLYTGYGDNYILVDMVMGKVRVQVKWNSWTADPLVIASRSGQLNDAEWHAFNIYLDYNVCNVSVSNCLSDAIDLGDGEECSLSQSVITSLWNINFNSPIYVGGVPIETTPLSTNGDPLSSFTGCLSELTINGVLVDFGSVIHSGGLVQGCPPLTNKRCMSNPCTGCIDGWNGRTCDVDTSPVTFDQTSSLVISFLPIILQTLSFQIKTTEMYTTLIHLGNHTTLQVIYGSLVMRHYSFISPFSLTLPANINDGVWHTIELDTTGAGVLAKVDGNRISGIRTVTMATREMATMTISGYVGCMQSVALNGNNVMLANNTNNFTVSAVRVQNGCHDNDPCASNTCPPKSACIPHWRGYECKCDEGYLPEDNRCDDPCDPNPCMNNGTCIHTGSAVQCVCSPIQIQGDFVVGRYCEVNHCPSRHFFRLEECRPCRCFNDYTTDDVCSPDGECHCTVNSYGSSTQSGLGCKACQCHPLGSSSLQCNETGDCTCHGGFTGPKCDTCLNPRQSLIDGVGCVDAVNVSGSFVLNNVVYEPNLMNNNNFISSIKDQLIYRLGLFSLLKDFILNIVPSMHHNSSMTLISFSLTSYNTQPSLSAHRIASIIQTIISSGCFSPYTTSSLTFTGDCTTSICNDTCSSSVDGVITCSNCPTGTVLDGVICRTTLPVDCEGDDRDGDGVPSSCDSCPYWYNPRQDDVTGCQAMEGMCPNEFHSDIIWSEVSANSTDTRPCPRPFIGTASRKCNTSGQWTHPDLTSCISPLNHRIQQLINNTLTLPPLSHDGVVHLLSDMVSLISSNTLSLDELLSFASLLNIAIHLPVFSPLDESIALPLMECLGHLSDIKHSNVWMTQDQGASSLLDIVETILAMPASSSFAINTPVASIKTIAYADGNVSFSDFIAGPFRSVQIPHDIITDGGSSHLSMIDLPSLALSLPLTDHVNFTSVQSVWSIHLSSNGSTVTKLHQPVNITFSHPPEFNSDDDVIAQCVTWNSTFDRWIESGCHSVANVNSTTCICYHLSSFTAFINSTNGVTPNPLHVLFYIANGISLCFLIFLLLSIIISTCFTNAFRAKGRAFLIVWIQLVISLILYHSLLMGVEIFTELSEIPCLVVGLLLQYLLLAVFSHFLMSCFAIATSYTGKFNDIIIVIITSFIAWAMPIIYTGITSGLIVLIGGTPLTLSYGFPNYCWICQFLSYIIYGPLIFISMVFVSALLVILLIYKRMIMIRPTKFLMLFHVLLYCYIFSNVVLLTLTIYSSQWVPSYLHYIFSVCSVLLPIVGMLVLIIALILLRCKSTSLTAKPSVQKEINASDLSFQSNQRIDNNSRELLNERDNIPRNNIPRNIILRDNVPIGNVPTEENEVNNNVDSVSDKTLSVIDTPQDNQWFVGKETSPPTCPSSAPREAVPLADEEIIDRLYAQVRIEEMLDQVELDKDPPIDHHWYSDTECEPQTAEVPRAPTEYRSLPLMKKTRVNFTDHDQTHSSNNGIFQSSASPIMQRNNHISESQMMVRRSSSHVTAPSPRQQMSLDRRPSHQLSIRYTNKHNNSQILESYH